MRDRMLAGQQRLTKLLTRSRTQLSMYNKQTLQETNAVKQADPKVI